MGKFGYGFRIYTGSLAHAESRSKYAGGFVNGKNTKAYNHDYYIKNKEKWGKKDPRDKNLKRSYKNVEEMSDSELYSYAKDTNARMNESYDRMSDDYDRVLQSVGGESKSMVRGMPVNAPLGASDKTKKVIDEYHTSLKVYEQDRKAANDAQKEIARRGKNRYSAVKNFLG